MNKIPKLTGNEDYALEGTGAFTVEASSTALVIIDMQYASACRTTGLGKWMADVGRQHIVKYRFDRIEQLVLPNIINLLSFFRQHKLKVVYVTVGSAMPDYSDAPAYKVASFRSKNNHAGAREHEILDEIRPLPEEPVVNKTTNSAFWSTGIDRLLTAMEARYLLFAGVSTNMCVEGTARDAADIGYRCVLIEDALATTHEELHRGTIINFQRTYGRATSTQHILEELSRGP